MITADDKLLVFEQFREDLTLPKFRRDDGEDVDGKDEDSEGDSDVGFRMARRLNVLDLGSASDGSITVRTEAFKLPSPWSKLAFWRSPPKPTPEQEGIPIQEFFAHVKNSQQELEIVEHRAQGYERAIASALKAGQHALVEQLKDGLNAYAMETQLVALGMLKFLTEETVVRFYKLAKKGLRLDWVQNFTRVIPEPIVAKVQRANELGVFDAYCVLHYDPHTKSYAETWAEKEAKRDPILFGLMKGRRVLYVVGDWVDEVCDLTLDQLADVLGAPAVGDLDSRRAEPYRSSAR